MQILLNIFRVITQRKRNFFFSQKVLTLHVPVLPLAEAYDNCSTQFRFPELLICPRAKQRLFTARQWHIATKHQASGMEEMPVLVNLSHHCLCRLPRNESNRNVSPREPSGSARQMRLDDVCILSSRFLGRLYFYPRC